jgi:hypothetical protein
MPLGGQNSSAERKRCWNGNERLILPPSKPGCSRVLSGCCQQNAKHVVLEHAGHHTAVAWLQLDKNELIRITARRSFDSNRINGMVLTRKLANDASWPSVVISQRCSKTGTVQSSIRKYFATDSGTPDPWFHFHNVCQFTVIVQLKSIFFDCKLSWNNCNKILLKIFHDCLYGWWHGCTSNYNALIPPLVNVFSWYWRNVPVCSRYVVGESVCLQLKI